MTGRLRMGMRATGVQGSFRTDGELRIVTKTSATPLITAPSDAGNFSRAIARIVRRR